MDYDIIWTSKAQLTFGEICDYIYSFFGGKALEVFIVRTEVFIEVIQKSPTIFKKFETRPNVRHGFLHQNTTLFYKIDQDKKRVYLLLFWDNRQNPINIRLE